MSVIASGSGGSGGGGAGDVVGPASATDNAVARWDGATGALVEDSPNGPFVDDSGNVTLSASAYVVSAAFYRAGSNSDPKAALNRGSASVGLGLALAVDRGIGFTSSTSEGPVDAELYRIAAGVIQAGDGAGGSCSLQARRVVEASTAGVGTPNVLSALESRKLLTNEGAGAEAYNTLPSAAAGLEYAFYCQTVSGIRIVAGAGDTIRLGPNVSAAAGFVRSETVGSALILVAINATEWVAISIIDTWTIDS